jgi:hypothetical protein
MGNVSLTNWFSFHFVLGFLVFGKKKTETLTQQNIEAAMAKQGYNIWVRWTDIV